MGGARALRVRATPRERGHRQTPSHGQANEHRAWLQSAGQRAPALQLQGHGPRRARRPAGLPPGRPQGYHASACGGRPRAASRGGRGRERQSVPQPSMPSRASGAARGEPNRQLRPILIPTLARERLDAPRPYAGARAAPINIGRRRM